MHFDIPEAGHSDTRILLQFRQQHQSPVTFFLEGEEVFCSFSTLYFADLHNKRFAFLSSKLVKNRISSAKGTELVLLMLRGFGLRTFAYIKTRTFISLQPNIVNIIKAQNSQQRSTFQRTQEFGNCA